MRRACSKGEQSIAFPSPLALPANFSVLDFPWAIACDRAYWRSDALFPQVFGLHQKLRTSGAAPASIPPGLHPRGLSSSTRRQILGLSENSLPSPLRGYGMIQTLICESSFPPLIVQPVTDRLLDISRLRSL